MIDREASRPAAVRTSYTVRELNLTIEADILELFALWDDVYPNVLKKKFDWLYLKNPAGLARVWIVSDAHGKIAGAAAVFPRRFRIAGASRLAGLAGDFLIHPTHRTLGPAVALQRQVCAEATRGWVDFLYGFPNRLAEPMFKRVGFALLTERGRWVIPIRTAPLLATMRGGRLLGALASPVADYSLRLGLWWRRRNAGVRYQVSNGPDERFRSLWNAVGIDVTVALDRTVDYLRWRYAAAPLSRYTIVEAVNRDGALAGYGVLRVVDSVGEVCELVGDGAAVLRGLAGELWRMARQAGAVRLEYMVGQRTGAAAILPRAGFIQRQDLHHALVYVPRDRDTRDVILNAAGWWLVQCDGDA